MPGTSHRSGILAKSSCAITGCPFAGLIAFLVYVQTAEGGTASQQPPVPEGTSTISGLKQTARDSTMAPRLCDAFRASTCGSLPCEAQAMLLPVRGVCQDHLAVLLQNTHMHVGLM